jgi:hypothetical protein
MADFRQYDIVRIKAIHRVVRLSDCVPGSETPKAGDIATIVEIFEKPRLGYALECINEITGETKYLTILAAEDLELELAT